jgi:hypothetical protein
LLIWSRDQELAGLNEIIKSKHPEKREEVMKTLTTILTIGLLIALTPAFTFSSDHERRAGDMDSHPGTYESKIYGIVEQLPVKGLSGTWVVNGREINVTKNTILKEKHGMIEVGAYVKVEGTHVDRTFTAREVEVKKAKEASHTGGVKR